MMKEKKQKPKKTKELQLGPSIAEHDLNTKINKAKDWLDKSDRVKITMTFKGRENAFKESGLEKFDKVVNALMEHGAVVSSPKKDVGNMVIIILDSKSKK